jgi:hypothetical protein
MAHFLIEVPHAEGKVACMRAMEIFMATGSHFLAKAEWDVKMASTKRG